VSEIMSVDVIRYRSWRAWLRTRWRTRCLVCGERTGGHTTARAAAHEAHRHLAWHGMLDAILRRAVRDGIIPGPDGG
jgi:hypothetical protein